MQAPNVSQGSTEEEKQFGDQNEFEVLPRASSQDEGLPHGNSSVVLETEFQTLMQNIHQGAPKVYER